MLTLATQKKDLTKEKKHAKSLDNKKPVKRYTQFQKKPCPNGKTVCDCHTKK